MSDLFENLRRYASSLGEVDDLVTHRATARALATQPVPHRWRSRLAPVAAAVALSVVGNAALVMTADSAVPGDLLYSIDRAGEEIADWLGSEADHRTERLVEAYELAALGDQEGALALAREALSGVFEETNLPVVVSNEKDTGLLLELAKDVVTAAHTGDSDAVQEAAHRLRDQAQVIADQSKPDNPGNQDNTPADTRPGGDGDSNNNSSGNGDKDKDK